MVLIKNINIWSQSFLNPLHLAQGKKIVKTETAKTIFHQLAYSCSCFRPLLTHFTLEQPLSSLSPHKPAPCLLKCSNNVHSSPHPVL